MENNLLYRVYEFVSHIIHLNDNGEGLSASAGTVHGKICPVTGLDISLQPRNSKFLSYTGVKWYFEHDRKIYEKKLVPRLSPLSREKDIEIQFREIAHSIRNTDSNPRNNTRRAIRKLLEQENSLFDNLKLIDRKKLQEAGIQNFRNQEYF